jgi:ubiquinone/menaquinone biosynthesis C-methylase UbiE
MECTVASNSFDDKAATWDDDPGKVERARVVAHEIRDAFPLTGTERLLEYGAGTGLVAAALRDAVGPVTLVDNSAGMLEVMRAKVAAGTIPDARVWELDLATAPVPDERFDLIVTVMTLHHIEDLAPVLTAFAELLEEGGHLCVVDLEAEGRSFHTDEFHGHHGFERAGLAGQLADAGFVDIAFRDCYLIDRGGVDYPTFLVIATR